MPLVDPHCIRCGLTNTRHIVVQPEIPSTPKILFLGRDPGEKEDVGPGAGHPFIGPAGQLLRRLIEDIGIPLEWCAFDNVVHCHTPRNRGPKGEEVAACSVWVNMVIRKVNPSVVVTLGQEALEAVTNPIEYNAKKPRLVLAEVQGQVIEFPTARLVAAYHPSAGLRNGDSRRKLVAALRLVKRELGLFDREPILEPGVVIDQERVPPGEARLGVDSEWRTDTGEVVVVGLAWREQDIIYTRWCTPEFLLTLPNQCVILHNASGDIHKLHLPLHLDFHDTLLKAYSLRIDQTHHTGSLGLKELSAGLLGLTWQTLTELGMPQDVEWDALVRYVENDVVATLLLDEYLEGVF